MSDEHAPPPPPPDIPPAAPPPPPPPPPSSAGGSAGTGPESGNRTIFLVLSYLGVLALIPFFMEKEDKEVQWHAKHGLVLLGSMFLIAIGMMILQTILGFVGDPGCFGCATFPLLTLGYMIVSIVCIVKALNGVRFKIPVVSDFVEKF